MLLLFFGDRQCLAPYCWYCPCVASRANNFLAGRRLAAVFRQLHARLSENRKRSDGSSPREERQRRGACARPSGRAGIFAKSPGRRPGVLALTFLSVRRAALAVRRREPRSGEGACRTCHFAALATLGSGRFVTVSSDLQTSKCSGMEVRATPAITAMERNGEAANWRSPARPRAEACRYLGVRHERKCRLADDGEIARHVAPGKSGDVSPHSKAER